MTASYRNIIGKINYALFFFALVGLVLPPHYGNMLWLLWLSSWLLEGRWLQQTNMRFGKSAIPVLLMVIYLAWALLSMLWAPDMQCAIHAVTRYATLPFLLLVFSYGLNENYRDMRFLETFVKACVFIVPAYYFMVHCAVHRDIVLYSQGEPVPPFHLVFDHGYSSAIKHRLFFCMVLTLGLICIPAIYNRTANRYARWSRLLTLGIAAAVILVGICFTGSRASLLTGVVLFAVALLDRYADRHHWWVILLVALGLLAALFVVVKCQPRMRDVATDPRVSIYKSAVIHASEVPFVGLGIGQQKQFMLDNYEDDNYRLGLQRGFNTHNQYIGTYFELGIIGLLLLLAAFISIPFCFTGRARHIGLLFCLMYLINMFTDDVFERFDPLTTLYVFMIVILSLQQYKSPASFLTDCQFHKQPSVQEL